MLQKADKDRLDLVLGVLESFNIRFKVAETVKRTGFQKGHVSNVLAGKIPMSENFYQTFLEKFTQKQKRVNVISKDADVGKEISRLIEITINQQAQINTLLKAFGIVSSQEIKKEADRLYDEYLKEQQ